MSVAEYLSCWFLVAGVSGLCHLLLPAGLRTAALTIKLRQLTLLPLFSFLLSFLLDFSTAKVSLSWQKDVGQIDTKMG